MRLSLVSDELRATGGSLGDAAGAVPVGRPALDGPLIRAMHVFTLLSLAFSARLYDVLGRQAMFFVARGSTAADIVWFVLILSVLLPAALVLVECLAGLLWRPLGVLLHGAIVLISATAIVLTALRPLEAIPAPTVLLLGPALGALAAAVYLRFRAARAVVTILSPVVVLSPALFLLGSAASPIVLGSADPAALNVESGNPVPVVMIVFDEFCGTSLMDETHQIDPVRYPNFAALAKEAYWFRNATTTSPSTHHALPSLLAGVYPRGEGCLPLASEYPHSIFTMVGQDYEVIEGEAETYLCPASLRARGAATQRVWNRLGSLLLDAGVLESYILFPQRWPLGRPDVTGRWGNFLGQDDEFGGRPNPHVHRREQFEQFVGQIAPAEKPTLYFAHVMLPHVPWVYAASGKEYQVPLDPGEAASPYVAHGVIGLERGVERWVDDPLAVAQAQQRYLLQLGFVDRLVGKLVQRLRHVGLYDQSLILLTADHGVSFRPGDVRRELSATNLPDVLSIPMLLKLPHQKQGITSDRNVQSVDVLPTIADVLDVELPWTVDGVTMIDDSKPAPSHKQYAPEEDRSERTCLDGRFAQKYDTLRAMRALLGSEGGAGGGSCGIGPHADLLGRRVEGLRVQQGSPWQIEILMPERFHEGDIESQWVPCYLAGRIASGPEERLPLDLAVAVNGTVCAVTRTFRIPRLEDRWSMMVPEGAFRAGENRVEIFVISAVGTEPALRSTRIVAGAEGR